MQCHVYFLGIPACIFTVYLGGTEGAPSRWELSEKFLKYRVKMPFYRPCSNKFGVNILVPVLIQ